MRDFFKPKLAPAGAVPPRVPNRSLDAAILVCGALVLAAALWLRPDARGVRLEQSAWLPPCPFKTITGLPCGSCGMTRSFVWAVRGEFGQSARMQPLGFLLFCGMVGAMADAAVSLLAGRSLRHRVGAWPRRWILMSLLILYLTGWGYVLATRWGTGF